jgi:membrane-bound serine protease (ClpP class)
MAFLRPFFLVLAAFGLALALAHTAAPQSENERPRVLAVEFDNDVNPVTADYLIDAIDRANRENYDAVVLLVDTPGGLDTAMRDIIKSELASEVPVILYVSPPGSRAASAGVFLAMAADVAAMAPGTNIGSSTPISSSGGNIPTDLRRKVVNDAAAYIRELAESHGRNGDWAEDAVRKAANVGATEALELGIVDYVAPDLPTLLNEIDGTTTEPKGIVLNTADAEIDTESMGFWTRLLDTLVDPNLIVLLMSIGLLGITIEVMNPGLLFPGTVGAICLIMGLFGLQVLPVSAAGVLLILLGFGFFVAEAFVISHGALALAGTVSFVIGALLLFDPAGDAYQVSIWVALGIGLTLALLIGVALTKVLQVRRTKPQTGEQELVGDTGVVRQTLDPEGYVFVHGELWKARTEDGAIESGATVQVDSIDEGLTLVVSRAEAPVAATSVRA